MGTVIDAVDKLPKLDEAPFYLDLEDQRYIKLNKLKP